MILRSLLVGLAIAIGSSAFAADFLESQRVKIVGQTDQTLIGNVADRLKIDNGGVAMPMINRTDVSTTQTASGNTSAFDSAGLMSVDAFFNLTALTGTSPTIQFHLDVSDDGSNWVTKMDMPRLSGTGTQTMRAQRIAARYYRYSWTIAGTTPSATFSVITTLKSQSVGPHRQAFKYGDIDLSVNGNTSSIFSADDCLNVNVTFVRAAGGANATVQIFGSSDGTNWSQVFGNVAVNPGTVNSTFLQAQAWRFYEAQVTTHAGVGTTADTQWSCN